MDDCGSDLTCDRFLDGRLKVWQPRKGYRAGVDPVILAAATPAHAEQRVLELGCGVGVASLCLAARVPRLALTGIEVQPDYADLARRNARDNGVAFEVHTADLRRLPDELRRQSFDHVILNPPYFLAHHRIPASDAGRENALAGETPLSEWIATATRRLKPKGHLTIILAAARLPALLAACDDRVGSIAVIPLSARPGRRADLIVFRARKGGRAAFCLCPPVVMHNGAAHRGEGDSYSPEMRAVLRRGASLRPVD